MISNEAEIHIKDGQLEIINKEGRVVVPIEDISQIMAHVLHNACIVDGVKMNIFTAIDVMIESLKRIILDDRSEKLKLPVIIPIESMERITQ